MHSRTRALNNILEEVGVKDIQFNIMIIGVLSVSDRPCTVV